jgi:RNA polymerase sigma-70 factor, ECF subfamily
VTDPPVGRPGRLTGRPTTLQITRERAHGAGLLTRPEVTVPTSRRPRGVRGDQTDRSRPHDGFVLALARGEDHALGELFDRVGGRVFGTVRRILRDPAQSEEVTQEVMLEVWRTAPRFDPRKGSADSWILTMAHRRAIDRVRSEQASRDRAQAIGTRDRPRPYDDVVEQVVLDEEHGQVTEALSALTDLQREAVELAYFEGYTYREIAERLDTPLGTIKTRMRDAMIRLRGALEVTRS